MITTFSLHGCDSFKDAIKFATDGKFDGILAVGGGSVMDTAKAANLYMCCPDNDFLDFVNAPVGKGLPITATLKPLICSKYTILLHYIEVCEAFHFTTNAVVEK